ncbi:Carboxylesterase [Syncephalis fuscata]|nr:Carboxylesterase [Syncephalis fuscata]
MLLSNFTSKFQFSLLLLLLTVADLSIGEQIRSNAQQPALDTPRMKKLNNTNLPDMTSEVSNHDVLLVATEHGQIRGRLNLSPTQRLAWPINRNKDPAQYSRVFAGIPYAEPPVGTRRFQSPAPIEKAWNGVRDAIEFKSDCPQLFISLDQSEDCLYLNVFVPPASRANPAKPFPVIFSIFGGAFYFGGANEFGVYNGRYLTDHKDAIIITANHRVNAFGFFASEEVRGNAGIEDQRAALLWIKRNIKAFGGDPNNVTLIGLSSGATSIGIHMTSPRTPQNLFHRAIMQSSPLGMSMRSQNDIRATSTELAQTLKCLNQYSKIDMNCMRSKSAKEVLQAIKESPHGPRSITEKMSDQFAWWPSIDNYNIVEDPLAAFQQGHFNRNIPVIMSSAQDEGALWVLSMTFPFMNVFGLKAPFASDKFPSAMKGIFGNSVNTMETFYPTQGSESDNKETYTRLFTDYVFVCPTTQMANSIRQHGGQVYTYHFTSKENALSFGYCSGRVCHASDLVLTWHMPLSLPMTSSLDRMSDIWIGYMTNFAVTGNPNQGPTTSITVGKDQTEKLHPWSPHTGPLGPYLRLDKTIEDMASPRANHCRALERIKATI